MPEETQAAAKSNIAWTLGKTVAVVGIVLSLFELYTAALVAMTAMRHRAVFLTCILVMTFLTKPLYKGAGRDRFNAALTVDLLLAALGQPKGELWLAENRQALGVPACVQLGASFDFVAGRASRAPKWMQRIGAEWLHRSWREPRRMIPRYFHNAVFLMRAIARDMTSRRETNDAARRKRQGGPGDRGGQAQRG